MAFPILDTPRTDAADQSHLSASAAPDFTTETSIPSPSKEGNDLLRQIRGMRAPNRNVNTTPRARAPLVDRHNVPSKSEFTPLLKSATRNRAGVQRLSFGKENGPLHTPAGLKASYSGNDSPALPLSSSIMEEQYTGSFLVDQSQHSPAMPVSSSSAVSTPMAILPRRGEGPLDHGNMATLKEQEARLEQIDKENFSLKLKIHFLEEAMRRNGKEFNEAAIKENTELKVDKVTLQRDLKHYRKLLAQAERELEDCRRQLLEYANRVQQRQADGASDEELERLRQDVTTKEEQIEKLEQDLERAEDEAYNKCNEDNRIALNELRDTIADLEADLRDKDRQLDEKQDEIEDLKDRQQDDDSAGEIDELKALLQERDDDLASLRDALARASEDRDSKLKEKDRIIEHKDDQLRELEDKLKSASQEQSSAARTRNQDMQTRDAQLEKLRQQLERAESQLQELDELRERLSNAERDQMVKSREHSRDMDDKDREIQSLEQRLKASSNQGDEAEQLHDQIADLEAEMRDKQRSIDQKDDDIEDLKSRLQQLENETDDELIAAQDRIQELEMEQEKANKDIQELRNVSAKSSPLKAESKAENALEEARARIAELEDDASYSREEEQRLQKELDRLRGELQRLQQSSNDQDDKHSSEKQSWLSQRQTLEFAKQSADRQLQELRDTNAQLHKIEGSLSSKESQLQKMLELERTRRDSDEAQLRRDVAFANEQTEAERNTSSNLRQDLQRSRGDLESSRAEQRKFQAKIVELEEEIEVLQIDSEEELERAKRQLESVQRDLSRSEADYDRAKAELHKVSAAQRASSATSTRSTPSPQRDLQQRVLQLETQLMTVRVERDELQERVTSAEPTRNKQTAEPDDDVAARSEWHQKFQQVQSQLMQLKKDRRSLEDNLATTSTELKVLQSSYDDLEDSRSTAERQLREVRAQMSQLQRDGDRKLQSQVAAYEHDISNLEQDLADAETKHAELLKKHEASESSAKQQRTRVATLEAEVAALRNATGDGGGATTTSPGERRDLHEMLKDAKLEAEDLALQLKQRDTRLAGAATRESDLRSQLERVREERKEVVSRADADLAEVDSLRKQVLQLKHQISTWRSAGKAAGDAPATEALEKRHMAELRGLARQIEYLSARCRREEAFRADLGFIKHYFQQTVEMYGRCNALDLRLVHGMGIATSQVLRDERQNERLQGPGCVALQPLGATGRKRKGTQSKAEPRSRPTLRVVGLTVLAAVRMERAAARWGVVRARHEELLRRLKGMKKERAGEAPRQQQQQQALGKRKSLR